MSCVTSVSYKVVVNGIKMDCILPMNVYAEVVHCHHIFTYSMGEAMARMIPELSCDKSAYYPSIAPRGDRVPILQYADDTLIFIRANRQSASKIKKVLDLYGSEVGQQLNNHKRT